MRLLSWPLSMPHPTELTFERARPCATQQFTLSRTHVDHSVPVGARDDRCPHPVFCSPAASPLTVSSSGRCQRRPVLLARRPATRRGRAAARWLSMSTNGRRRPDRRVQVRLPLEHLGLPQQREHHPPGQRQLARAPAPRGRAGRPARGRRRRGRPRSWPGSSRRRRPATANTGHVAVGLPRARRGTASAASPLPSPYQPGRLTRVIDQAKTHGMARRSSRLRPDSDPLRPRRARPEPQVGQQVQRARHREEVGEAGLLDERAEGPPATPRRRRRRRPRTAPRARRGRCACAGGVGEQDGGGDALEVLLGDPHVGVAGEDHLALLGDLEPAVDRAGRLGRDGPVQRTAAAAERTAAAVEEGQLDAVPLAPRRPAPPGPGAGRAWPTAGPTSLAESEYPSITSTRRSTRCQPGGASTAGPTHASSVRSAASRSAPVSNSGTTSSAERTRHPTASRASARTATRSAADWLNETTYRPQLLGGPSAAGATP